MEEVFKMCDKTWMRGKKKYIFILFLIFIIYPSIAYPVDDSNTIFLMHFNNSYVENAGHGIISQSNTKFDSSIVKFGSDSLNMTNDTAQIKISTSGIDISPCTVDWWMYSTDWASQPIVMIGDATSNGYIQYYSGLLKYDHASNLLNFGDPSLNEWHHYALVDNGTYLMAFRDGNIISTISKGTYKLIDGGTYFYIGTTSGYHQYYLRGYIDEFRISNIDRYNSHYFTPPTEEYLPPPPPSPIYPSIYWAGIPTSGDHPLTVDFTFSGSNTSSWDWNFGDGNSSSQENPQHIYDFAGNFDVSLCGSNSNGTSCLNRTSYIIVTTPTPTPTTTPTTTTTIPPITNNCSLELYESGINYLTWHYNTSINISHITVDDISQTVYPDGLITITKLDSDSLHIVRIWNDNETCYLVSKTNIDSLTEIINFIWDYWYIWLAILLMILSLFTIGELSLFAAMIFFVEFINSAIFKESFFSAVFMLGLMVTSIVISGYKVKR